MVDCLSGEPENCLQNRVGENIYNTEIVANKEELFEKMTKNASESDVKRIDENINKMKIGKLAKIWDKVMLLYRFVKDSKAPWGGKAIAIGALIYMISTIDAVPDIIPVAGLLDDVAIILAAIAKLLKDLEKYK